MMSGLRSAVLVLVTVGVFTTQGADPDAAGRMVIATKIYSLVQQYFAHWEGAARSDVDAAYRTYVADALAATDRKGFDLATLRFIAALHNGHTQFSDDQADGRPLKFRLREVEHQWVVTVSQESGLPRGTIVNTLNGRPVGDVVTELAQYVAASNDRLARTHVFSYPGLFPERISLGLADGQVVVVDRSVKATNPPQMARASEGRWLREGQTAYIRVPSFGDPVFERSAIDLVRQYSSAPNLIVDVRGNGGGTTPRQLID